MVWEYLPDAAHFHGGDVQCIAHGLSVRFGPESCLVEASRIVLYIRLAYESRGLHSTFYSPTGSATCCIQSLSIGSPETVSHQGRHLGVHPAKIT
jgi:hypothetical protein